MGNVRGLRFRLCPECKEVTPQRTLYVKAREDGRPKWLQIFWACARCHNPNHIILPIYSLEPSMSPLPTPLAISIVNALCGGPIDVDELIMNLRKHRPEGVRHIFNQEVQLTLEFLKGRGLVKEGAGDRTVRVLEVLQNRPRSSGLSPCPRESSHRGSRRSSLVSLYAQKSKEPANTTRLVSVGVLCRICQYVRLDELG